MGRYGQLGLGNKEDHSKFVLVMQNVEKVACGSYFSIVQKSKIIFKIIFFFFY